MGRKRKNLSFEPTEVKIITNFVAGDYMPYSNKRIYFTIPEQVMDVLEQYRITYTYYKTANKFLCSIFSFYRINPDYYQMDKFDFLSYKNLPISRNYNFSLYFNEEQLFHLTMMAHLNHRTISEQTDHFIYTIYHYYKDFVYLNKAV